jgi:HAE1 family hydrophobic/amphiphilic exporter-1
VDGIENAKVKNWVNGDRNIALAVYRQPGANTVEVVKRVRAMFEDIEREAPPGVKISVINDRSEFIENSIHEVEYHLLLSVLLVVLVILMFLRSARSTLITALILPTSVIGTFAAMYLLGFSLNNLSLMAIILAVGFVVDDAIVVLENITRHMEMGKSRMQAALEGSKEIAFTVLSMTISLSAVFIPILFMEGLLGRLFREFAVTIGMAVLISGAIALSMTPMMCSLMLKPVHEHGPVYRFFERVFDGARDFYGITLRWTMRYRGLMLIASGIVLALTVVLYNLVPHGFIPRQDTGVIFGNTRAPEGVTFEQLEARQRSVEAIIQKHPEVEAVMSTAGQGFGGQTGDNIGRVIVRLKPREERKLSADEVIRELRPSFAGGSQGLQVFMTNPASIRIGSLTGNADYQLVVQGTDLKALYAAAQEFELKLREAGFLRDISTNLELRNPEIQISILRDRAAVLGVSPQQIESTLYNAYGGRQISTIYGATDQYLVLLELDPRFQRDINALRSLHVQSNTGRMVPVQAVALFVEQDRVRKVCDQKLSADATLRVHHDRIMHSDSLNEVSYEARIVVGGDTDHDQPFALTFASHRLERRHRLHAGRATGRPKVEQRHSLPRGKADHRSLERHLRAGTHGSVEQGMRIAFGNSGSASVDERSQREQSLERSPSFHRAHQGGIS